MEVGGLPALPEEETWGLLCEVFPCYFLTHLSLCLYSFFFNSLHLSSILIIEGLHKIEAAVTRSEAEGFCRLLKGAASHPSLSSILPPMKKCHPAPTTKASKPPLQESSKVSPEVCVSVVEEMEQIPEAPLKLVPEAPSLVAAEAPEEAIPAHMTPLCLQLGALRGCTSARLRVARRGH